MSFGRRTTSIGPMAFHEIPVLSLAAWNGPEADRTGFADELSAICHEVGFLSVVDHGIDPEFLRDYFDALKSFFALPEATKGQIDKINSPWFRGWERVGAELTDARVDYREQIDVWSELKPRGPDADPQYLRLEGPNQWLAEDQLPGFRALVERFQREMGDLADRLMEAMSVALGLDADHLAQRFGTDRMSLVKLIHYPPTPPGAAGVNPHHDTGFLTLLLQHGVGGLQVQNEHDAWIDVPVRDDAIVVNLGEMLQTITGNYFVATTHRVVTGEERYSSGYFHGPELATALAPLPLDDRFAAAVAASPHHRDAGFMAHPDELADGPRGIGSAPVDTYGQQLWNYFTRSYPELVARHHPDL